MTFEQTTMSEPHAPLMNGSPTYASDSASRAAFEPLLASIIGGLSGALAFALCALWLGPLTGILIAVACAATALERRRWAASILFAVTGALCGLAFVLPTTPILVSGGVFAIGLVRAARTPIAPATV